MNKIHIIATDIDDQVLEKARDGVYAASSLKGLPDPNIRINILKKWVKSISK